MVALKSHRTLGPYNAKIETRERRRLRVNECRISISPQIHIYPTSVYLGKFGYDGKLFLEVLKDET